MIYEWYRGSDTSKAVPRRLNDLRQHEEAMSYKEKIKVFRELLEVEKEPNSRGYLLWRIGREYADEHCQEEAIAAKLPAFTNCSSISTISLMFWRNHGSMWGRR